MSTKFDTAEMGKKVIKMRGDPSVAPDASIGIPVNAQGDLENVLVLLSDIVKYNGSHTFEIIFIVNNYPENDEPDALQTYRNMGIEVIAKPKVQIPGEAVGFTARIYTVRAAKTEYVILFDADCRIPNSTALLDWYVKEFRAGAAAAYTHVGYYDLRPHSSIYFRVFLHHASRWIKRTIFRIPTTRGSNYAVHRTKTLQLYDDGWLADEMNVGPTIKKKAGRVAYSGAKELDVLTSGRVFEGGWLHLVRYFLIRLIYNIRVLPVGQDVAKRTGRENDPIVRFVGNQRVKDDELNND